MTQLRRSLREVAKKHFWYADHERPKTSSTISRIIGYRSEYSIIRQIGKGGMAKVYSVTDKNNRAQYAAKVLHEVYAQNQEWAKSVYQEGRILAEIEHPDVPRLMDFGVLEGGVPFIVMELLSGVELGDKIDNRWNLKKCGLEDKEVLDIGIWLCNLVSSLHEQGIIVRDLSSNNIRLLSDESKKLFDFGLSKFTKKTELNDFTDNDPESDESKEKDMIGTPEFMSPEQINCQKTDERSDIYAIGVVLYDMITGGRPFNALRYADKTHKKPAKPLMEDTELDRRLNKIIMCCLEINPNNRFQKAKEIEEELKTCVIMLEPKA